MMNGSDNRNFTRRRLVFTTFTLLGFIYLLYGVARLQIGKKEVYVQQSLSNSIRQIEQYPVRGLIVDKNGRILVDNRPAFSAAIIPRIVNDSTVTILCKKLQLDETKVRQTLKKEYGFRPVIVSRDISQKQLVFLQENRLSLPGALIVVDPKRFYADSVYSPHIFGNLGEVTESEETGSVYDIGDMIGKTGLEKTYDLDIRGTKGVRFVRVDATGKELGTYDVNRNVAPIHGSDIYLHMDYDLQRFAETLLGDRRGALVAINVRNGGILALASKPDFDPRLLTGKIDAKIWQELVSDESHPLYSRATQSRYPPGSTYKIVAALAALQEKIITPEWTEYCPGYFQLGRRTIHCWNAKGHGRVNLLQAIKGSCNVYFYKLGLKIGLETWSKYSTMLGFGALTGIDLPNESKGLVPTVDYFNRVYGKNGWTKGNLANLAIGQGELLVTPLQIAQFAMILANRGVYHTPHLVESIYDYTQKKRIQFPYESHYIPGISNEVYDVLREGMREVCDGGTGWRGKVPGIEMAGKTGTAQNPHGDSHAWFMAFAPFDYPEVAISVIIENGGGGGAVAAPLARKFLEMYFFGKLIPRPVAKKDTTNLQTDDSQIPVIDFDQFQPIRILRPQGNN